MVTLIALLLSWGHGQVRPRSLSTSGCPTPRKAPPGRALITPPPWSLAGVFMVARCASISPLAPAMNVVAVTGGLTAILRQPSARTQNDHQRVIAYSTIQPARVHVPGPPEVGAFSAGTLPTDDPFLFQGPPVPRRGQRRSTPCRAKTQDMHQDGALRPRSRSPSGCFTSGSFALAGIFPWRDFSAKTKSCGCLQFLGTRRVLWVLGITGAFLTAFYSFPVD